MIVSGTVNQNIYILKSLIEILGIQTYDIKEIRGRLENRIFLCSGNGPFQHTLLETLICDLGGVVFKDVSNSYDMVTTLIIGREDFETENIVIATNNVELVLSQEAFVRYALLGKVPNYTISDPRILHHTGLMFLLSTPFNGPFPFDRETKIKNLLSRANFEIPKSMNHLETFMGMLFGGNYSFIRALRLLGYSEKQLSLVPTNVFSLLVVEILHALRNYYQTIGNLKDWELIERRFGFLRESPETFVKIGKELEVPAWKVSTRIKRCMKRLRHPLRSKALSKVITLTIYYIIGIPEDVRYLDLVPLRS